MRVPSPISTVIDLLGGPRIFAIPFHSATYDGRAARRVRPLCAPGTRLPTVGVTSALLTISRSLVSHVPGQATHVIIVVMRDGTYAVILRRASPRNRAGVLVARIDGVCAEDLRATVERMSGLLLSPRDTSTTKRPPPRRPRITHAQDPCTTQP